MPALLPRCLLFLSLATFTFAAEQSVVRVAGSTHFQLVIVDSAKSTPARDALHKAFATSLGKSLSAAVQMKCLPADQAAFGLSTGRFHAALSIGKNLPRSLVLGGYSRLNAALGSEKYQQWAYLIFSNDDEGLDKLLNTAFASALSDPLFLNAFDGGMETEVQPNKGATVAASDR